MSLPAEIFGPTTLDCGCFLNPVEVDGSRELRVSPCRPECANLAELLRLAVEANKPIEARRAP